MNKPSLHIVNSCYNPSGEWAQSFILQAQQYELILSNYSITFILVNDGSIIDLQSDVDKIKSSLDHFNYYSYTDNKGKGHALRFGISQADASIYCYTDVDFPYEAESLQKMIKKLESKNLDITLGIRNSDYFKKIPFQRRLISKALIVFNKYFLRLEHSDTQCGIKLISHKAKETFLNVKNNGFLFEVEFIKKAEGTLEIGTQVVELRKQTKLKNVKASTLFHLLLEYFTLRK